MNQPTRPDEPYTADGGMTHQPDHVVESVRDQYAAVARSGLSNDNAAVRAVAEAFGYSEQQLSSLPAESNMGLSCGNPVAVAALRPGEVVVDLGCGGGLDVILASRQVGSTGKAIGIDMTSEMIDRARAAAAKADTSNVEFHLATLDRLPLPDNSVDCVISNCVINLVPDKRRALDEIARVLKPGGRVAISDIALKQPLPDKVRSSLEAYVGCIAGAILIDDYRRSLEQAGFDAVTVTDTGADLNAYAQAGGGACCSAESDPSGSSEPDACCSVGSDANPAPLHDQLTEVLTRFDANGYAASVRVHAVKPTNPRNDEMTTEPREVQVYDKPMCCSTGVCGPQVDPVLPRFAADLDHLKDVGHHVERFNLAQQPAAFAQNETVKSILVADGNDCLPIILVDGQVVSRGAYPDRQRLLQFAGGDTGANAAPETAAAAPQSNPIPVTGNPGGCCGGSSC